MTLHHVGLLRFAPGTTPETVEAVIDAIRGLPGQIGGVETYDVGADVGATEDNWDLAITATFADHDAYAVYRDHPVHRQVITELIAPVLAERAAVQFET